MSNPSQSRTGHTKAHGIDPAAALVAILHQTISKLQILSPQTLRRLGTIHFGDISAINPALVVRATARQQHIIRMPIETQNARLQRLSDVLRHPELLVALVVADTDELEAASHCKLILVGTPFAAVRRSRYSQYHQIGFPLLAIVVPHIRILILCNLKNIDLIKIFFLKSDNIVW